MNLLVHIYTTTDSLTPRRQDKLDIDNAYLVRLRQERQLSYVLEKEPEVERSFYFYIE